MSKVVTFVIPSSAAQAYQALANKYSAIEPPTWALLLANAVRKEGYDPCILDFDADPSPDIEHAAYRISDTNTDIAVFVLYGQNPNSGTTMMIGASVLARQLKLIRPSIKIVFIGSHASALPYDVIGLHYVDELDKVRGLVYKKHGFAKIGAPAELVKTEDMDRVMPGYAWDLIDFNKYRAHYWHSNFLDEGRTPFAAISTSLGCSFGCNFCMINIVNRTSYTPLTVSSDSRGMRFWSPELMLKEFEYLWEKGVRTVRLTDEMFFLNKKYYVPILQGLVDRGMNFNFWAYARVDSVRKDQLELFKKAGVNWLALGIEAGNPQVRLEIDKGRFKQVDIREVVQDIKDAGINVLGNYMFGFPEDTYETMQETLDLALELNCEHANFYAAMALPGSPLYKEAVENNWELPQTFDEFAFLSYDCKPLRTKNLTGAEVLKFRDEAWHKYFSHEPFLNLVENKFGLQSRQNIEEMSKIRLKRKILGD